MYHIVLWAGCIISALAMWPHETSHYHHCANLSEDTDLIKCLSDIFCRVCKIKHLLSVIYYAIYGAVCFQFTHFSRDDWESIYFVLSSSSNQKYELLSNVMGQVMKQWYALYVLLYSYNRTCLDKVKQHFFHANTNLCPNGAYQLAAIADANTQVPCLLKSLQITGRLVTLRWNPQLPNLQKSCSDQLNEWLSV